MKSQRQRTRRDHAGQVAMLLPADGSRPYPLILVRRESKTYWEVISEYNGPESAGEQCLRPLTKLEAGR